MTAELSLNCLLFDEHFMGQLCDKGCNKNGQRCNQYHNQGNQRTDGQHKYNGAHNGNNTRKKLSKTLKQTVGYLVHIVHQTADDVSMGMTVQIFQRHGIQFLIRLYTHILCRKIRQFMNAVCHNPLKDRRNHNGCGQNTNGL